MFITKLPVKRPDRSSNTSRRNSTRFSKQSNELRSFVDLVKQVSGNYAFETIQRLELSRMKLNSMDKFRFLEWTSLVSLNLSHNNIRHIEGLYINSLSNMEHLDLSYNKIQEIPKDFLKRENSLRTLLLQGNNELNKVECIRNLSAVSNNLTHLCFQKRGGQDACPLCKNGKIGLYHALIFETCPKLRILDDGSIKVLKIYLKYEASPVDISKYCDENEN